MDIFDIATRFFNFLATLTMTFFTLIFIILPFYAEPDKDNKNTFASSAPKNPMIKQKLLICFVISAVISIILEYIFHFSNFSLKQFILGL